jgi:hypothetical protein
MVFAKLLDILLNFHQGLMRKAQMGRIFAKINKDIRVIRLFAEFALSFS